MIDRYKDSCTDLLDDEGIRTVYCGYSDPTQDDSENYHHKKAMNDGKEPMPDYSTDELLEMMKKARSQ